LKAQTAAAEQIAQSPQAGPDAALTISLNDDERKILEYLKRVKKASPRDMQLCLELSKATLFRRLKRLGEAKLVVGSGSTTAIRYRLAEPGDCFLEKRATVVPSPKTAEANCIEM
jgi:hypothetical protein